MSAATRQVAAPLFLEGSQYWDDLRSELRRKMDQTNEVLFQHGLADGQLIQWLPGSGIDILRAQHPSTGIKADIHFRSWGPVISGKITGYQADDYRFFPEEFEVLIAKDLDGAAVAIFDEGRSFAPRELAAYLMQHFRRCFPDISLPCEDLGGVRALEAVAS